MQGGQGTACAHAPALSSACPAGLPLRAAARSWRAPSRACRPRLPACCLDHPADVPRECVQGGLRPATPPGSLNPWPTPTGRAHPFLRPACTLRREVEHSCDFEEVIITPDIEVKTRKESKACRKAVQDVSAPPAAGTPVATNRCCSRWGGAVSDAWRPTWVACPHLPCPARLLCPARAGCRPFPRWAPSTSRT